MCETSAGWQGWHEIGYKQDARAVWENFLERGESWRWLGDPRSENVRRSVFSHDSSSSFFRLFGPKIPEKSKPLRFLGGAGGRFCHFENDARCVKITRMREKSPAGRLVQAGKRSAIFA
jgi:hypothetical protein